MSARSCERCGEPIPATSRRDARFCSRNCQKRAWEDANPLTCARCGGPHPRRGSPNAERCLACEVELRQQAAKARDDDIVLMWEQGLPAVQIARELGYGANSHPPELSRLMREGRIKARRARVRQRHEAAS